MAGTLSEQEFLALIGNAPLVSIDLALRDSDGRVLVGHRKNAPARGFLFVPGGRVEKDQSLEEAFVRICMDEAGIERQVDDGRFVGVYEHFYPEDNALDVPSVNTHYVVLGFEVNGIPATTSLSGDQHTSSDWRDLASLLADPQVHENAKFMLRDLRECAARNDSLDAAMQYELVAARRDSANSLLWQTPVLSLTAQAFLFSVALNPSSGPLSRAIASGLALITALASVQLLLKHRFYEVSDAEWLRQFERRHRWQGLEVVSQRPAPKTLPHRLPAHEIWVGILLLFGAAALFELFYVVGRYLLPYMHG